METQRDRKAKYDSITQQLADTGEVQVSTSDPDSRQMITQNNRDQLGFGECWTDLLSVQPSTYFQFDWKK